MKINFCAATTTRLMGVVGVYLNYDIEEINYAEVFVMDYDMGEVTKHDILKSPGYDRIKALLEESFGGLGGELIQLNFYLEFLKIFYAEYRRTGSPTYKDVKKKSPLLKLVDGRKGRGKPALSLLFPSHELSAYEVIHYFMMRLFADDEVASLLAIDDYPPFLMDFTVIKNTLTKRFRNDGSDVYDFSCLVFGDSYFLLGGKIELKDNLVDTFNLDEITPLTPLQVAQTLRQKEIISVYTIENPTFEEAFTFENRRLAPHLYENGRLYISYRYDNNHVDSDVFTLSDDIEASLFITDGRQVILSTRTEENSLYWNEKLVNRYGDSLLRIGEWIFDEEVLLDFINTGLLNFLEWMD